MRMYLTGNVNQNGFWSNWVSCGQRNFVLCVGNAKMHVSISLKRGLTVSFVLWTYDCT